MGKGVARSLAGWCFFLHAGVDVLVVARGRSESGGGRMDGQTDGWMDGCCQHVWYCTYCRFKVGMHRVVSNV